MKKLEDILSDYDDFLKELERKPRIGDWKRENNNAAIMKATDLQQECPAWISEHELDAGLRRRYLHFKQSLGRF